MRKAAEPRGAQSSVPQRLVAVFIGAFLLLFAALPARANYASLVMDASTGQVLYEANADVLRYPASLTKMMTLYMLFEALDRGRITLDQPLYTSAHAASQAPTKLGLRVGQRIAVEDAILGLVTKSANDAAALIAEELGGSEDHFAAQMTAQAHQLGMTQTYFANASGLPDPNQVTTARDMAILALALLHDYPHYYHYFGTEQFYWRGAMLANHNRLLGAYPGIDGIKTGYTHAAGFNLVASAVRGDRRLIGVVMGAHSSGIRNVLMTSLLDQGFMGGNISLAGMDEPDEPGPEPGTSSWASALEPVSAAAAAVVPVRISREARVERRPARSEARTASARSRGKATTVASRGKPVKLTAKSPAKLAAKTPTKNEQAKAGGKGGSKVVLASTKATPKAATTAAKKGGATASRPVSSQVKAKPATATAMKPAAKPGKTAKTTASSGKRRVADNARGVRS
ncbi:MAG: D-alanyl-D-alanine carboxypeptidase family protein [Rhodospirillales bacterium]